MMGIHKMVALALALSVMVAPAHAYFGRRAPVDHAEEMRAFVQRIATFARRADRDFVVIAAGAPELVAEIPDVPGEEPLVPAHRYLSALDGVLFYGTTPDAASASPQNGSADGASHGTDAAPDGESRDWQAHAGIVRDAGRTVFVVDRAATAETARASRAKRREHGFVPFAAPAPGPEVTALPDYARRPPRENADTVTDVTAVANFAYVGSTTAYGSETRLVEALKNTNYDMLVVDAFHGRSALSKNSVRALRYKKLGARRLVLAHINIAIAAPDRYYWQPEWQQGAPGWIDIPVEGAPGHHAVRYWDEDWQRIITGDAKSYIAGLITLGFDGVVVEGLDTWRTFALGETS